MLSLVAMSSKNKNLKVSDCSDQPRTSSRGRIKRAFLPIATAVAIVLSSVSCKNITEESLYEEWQKTEKLKGYYNSTYDSRESLKRQLREIEKKLNNPDLNKPERRELENQRKGIVKNIKDLNDDIDEYFSEWNKAVNKYMKDRAKYAGESAQNENIDSSPNNVDWRLQSVPSPNE